MPVMAGFGLRSSCRTELDLQLASGSQGYLFEYSNTDLAVPIFHTANKNPEKVWMIKQAYL